MMICRDVTLWRLPANMVSDYDKNRRHNVTSLHLFDHEIGAIYSFVWRLRFSVYCFLRYPKQFDFKDKGRTCRDAGL